MSPPSTTSATEAAGARGGTGEAWRHVVADHRRGPAWTSLAVIRPPMLPRPMNPTGSLTAAAPVLAGPVQGDVRRRGVPGARAA